MIELTISTINYTTYADNGVDFTDHESPIITTQTITCKESELASKIDNDGINSCQKSTPRDFVFSLAEWEEFDPDEELGLIETHKILNDDEIYVASRCGGGKVLAIECGKYSFNHYFQDFAIEQPCERSETIVKWHTI